MINQGIEPTNFLNDLLEIIYFIQQKKNIGNFDSDLSISESELKTIDSISNNINISTLIIFWQLILKVLEELSVVSNPILSLEMLIVRLVHLKDMPSYESILDLVSKNESNDTTINNNLIRPTEVDALLANYSKAKKILKWEPKVSFDNLVIGMVESDLEFITNYRHKLK